MIRSWFPAARIREIADLDRENNLGIFDIHVNGVLLHSRKCTSRKYGVPGHLWLRDERARQSAVWHAINSIQAPHSFKEFPGDSQQRGKSFGEGYPSVSVRSSSYHTTHATRVVEMINGWFHDGKPHVAEILDDECQWNFEIEVNGVLLHSRSTQWHGFFHDDWSQQHLVWRAISDLLPDARTMAVKGASP